MNNLKSARNAKGLSQGALGEKVNVQKSAISKYERGDIQPSQDVLIKLAEVLDVSIDYLLGREPVKSRSVRVPVLGRVAAGVPIEAIEDIMDTEEIPVEWTRDGSEFFGLQIKGDSMAPRIKDGDVVIVRQQPNIESGEVAVVLVNGQDATVKKVVKHKDGISLIPFNTAYSPKFYTADEVVSMPISIIGKVVELRGKF